VAKKFSDLCDELLVSLDLKVTSIANKAMLLWLLCSDNPLCYTNHRLAW
jgi:hypothetical protein